LPHQSTQSDLSSGAKTHQSGDHYDDVDGNHLCNKYDQESMASRKNNTKI